MTKISTGNVGLDEMLCGGLPKGRIVLVLGGPGSGKTMLALQFIVDGAKKGEKGIYVSLEEPLNLIKENTASFGWNLEELEKKNKIRLIDGSDLAYNVPESSQEDDQKPKLMARRLASQIKEAAEKFGATRIAVDPVTSAVIHQRFPTDKRFEVLRLIKALRALPCTCMVTSEFSSSSAGEFYVEEYLADGVIVLSKTLQDFNLIKTIRIEKMRGTSHDDQPRRYDIADKGVVVYNTESVTI